MTFEFPKQFLGKQRMLSENNVTYQNPIFLFFMNELVNQDMNFNFLTLHNGQTMTLHINSYSNFHCSFWLVAK